MRNPNSRVFGPASHNSPRLRFQFDYTGIAVQYVPFVMPFFGAGAGRRRPVKQGKGAWLALGCLLLAAVPAFGHHSFGAEYDGTKPVT